MSASDASSLRFALALNRGGYTDDEVMLLICYIDHALFAIRHTERMATCAPVYTHTRQEVEPVAVSAVTLGKLYHLLKSDDFTDNRVALLEKHLDDAVAAATYARQWNRSIPPWSEPLQLSVSVAAGLRRVDSKRPLVMG